MTKELTFTLLGTGSSGGVPRIGNDWGACDPDNPRNRRRRCAMLVEQTVSANKTSILVDTGPDMREQLLAAKVEYLDAAVLTHSHADHIFGMDDLRQLAIRHREKINVYMDAATSKQVMGAFGYCYQQAENSSYPAICREHRIVAPDPFHITGAGGSIHLQPFEVCHGDIQALGFRIGQFAYLPDVKTVEARTCQQYLANLDTLVLDALRYTTHPTHMNVDEALAFIEQVKPEKAYLTNMHSALDYAELRNKLPPGVEPAYDGLQITGSC